MLNKEFYSNCNPCPMKNHNCPFLENGIVCPEKDKLEESFHILLLLATNTRLNSRNMADGYTSLKINGHQVEPNVFQTICRWLNENNENFVATDTNKYKK